MLLLKQNTTKKKRVDKNIRSINFDTAKNESGKYKVKTFSNNAIYANASKLGYHLLELYYLSFQKNYPKKENIWKFYLAIYYLKKLIYLFYKKYSNKLSATSFAINIALSIAKLIIKSGTKLAKEKQSQPNNSSNK